MGKVYPSIKGLYQKKKDMRHILKKNWSKYREKKELKNCFVKRPSQYTRYHTKNSGMHKLMAEVATGAVL